MEPIGTTSNWHYCNLPVHVPQYVYEGVPPAPQCVLSVRVPQAWQAWHAHVQAYHACRSHVQAQIDELQANKRAAVEIEDYGHAATLKRKIDALGAKMEDAEKEGWSADVRRHSPALRPILHDPPPPPPGLIRAWLHTPAGHGECWSWSCDRPHVAGQGRR